MSKLFALALLFLNINLFACSGKSKETVLTTKKEDVKTVSEKEIIPGSWQFSKYLPLLKGKKVGLIVNHTSTVGTGHLADTLLAQNVEIVKIFAPEHGFRGLADAGETVKNDIDIKTGLPVISLYGKNKKPSPDQLQNVDILVFDIQDVGARFYTYISTMHYAMEAAAENNIDFIVLDRPNPNADIIDGPVLDLKHSSFVGMHPIPVVHGLTVGELAQMINGEKWLKGGINCNLKVIKVQNYSHKNSYSLPVKPSPNLPNDLSIKLYPSLCLFEGTNISVARGTKFPFQAIGYPDPAFGTFTFTPVSIDGMSKNPPFKNKKCYGINFRDKEFSKGFTLKYLIDFYNISKDKESFFNNFFVKLAGNEKLQKQIEQGLSEKEIRESWQPELKNYKKIRKQYLLYEDFE